jgi:glycosyltransferase involved in cell wall biosynthesis
MNVAVCIATYRRESMLRALLRSLEQLAFCKVQVPAICVVVIDNDWQCSALPVVCEFPSYVHRLRYRVEANRGVSYARNAALEAARTADFVAFVDDDEEVPPHWLDELLAVQYSFGAPIVAGPVIPKYDALPAAWISEVTLHRRKRYRTGALVRSTGAGNCLLSQEVVRATGPEWFHPAFADSGGEDTHFFRRCERLGFAITWADDAIVYERVPEERLTPHYLVQRARDGGNQWTRTQIAFETSAFRLAFRAGAGVIRILQGGACAMATALLSPSQRLRGQLRMAEGVGSLSAFLGRKYPTYGPDAR